jgi:hypothetical protein
MVFIAFRTSVARRYMYLFADKKSWLFFGGPWIQGRQMVYFQTKIPIWVNFGGPCNGRCWYILWRFGIFFPFWYIFTRFGMLYQDKSGNPAWNGKRWYLKWPFVIFYGHLYTDCMVLWYLVYFPHLVMCTKRNPATMFRTSQ